MCIKNGERRGSSMTNARHKAAIQNKNKKQSGMVGAVIFVVVLSLLPYLVPSYGIIIQQREGTAFVSKNIKGAFGAIASISMILSLPLIVYMSFSARRIISGICFHRFLNGFFAIMMLYTGAYSLLELFVLTKNSDQHWDAVAFMSSYVGVVTLSAFFFGCIYTDERNERRFKKMTVYPFLFMSLGTSLIFIPFLAKKIGGIILSVMLTGQTIAAWNLFTDAHDDTPRSYEPKINS